MKGMSGKVLAIVMTLIVAIFLLALLWTGLFKFVPLLSGLAEGVVKGVRGAVCDAIPYIGFLFCI